MREDFSWLDKRRLPEPHCLSVGGRVIVSSLVLLA